MNNRHSGMNVFEIYKIANVTDDNFTEVQTEIVSSLGNMTSMFNDQLNDTNVSNGSNRTEKINTKITEIQNLSTE